MGVLAVDLNGLKRANDEFGHAAGDALLRRAGEALKNLGDTAQAARVGGDEFACLLPRHTAIEMATLMESLKLVVELNNQFYQGPALSFSIGTAVWSAGRLDRACGRRTMPCTRRSGFTTRVALTAAGEGRNARARAVLAAPKIGKFASPAGCTHRTAHAFVRANHLAILAVHGQRDHVGGAAAARSGLASVCAGATGRTGRVSPST